jgi:PAS domain S-box-containing protein
MAHCSRPYIIRELISTMEVIIYSFFIISGAAGISYYAIKTRYARLLEEEQEKAYSARSSELLLAAEKQKIEAVLKEKEHQLSEMRAHEDSRSISLSTEVLSKDKQIQSLSAQLQKETRERTTLEQELSEKEQQEKLLSQQIHLEESRTSTLHNDVTSKEKMIQSLNEELTKESVRRSEIEAELLEKNSSIEMLTDQLHQLTIQTESLNGDISRRDLNLQTLSAQLQQESDQRKILAEQLQLEEKELSAMMNELTKKGEEFQSVLTAQSMEQQQLSDELQNEIENRKVIELQMINKEAEYQGAVKDLEQRNQQLQAELSVIKISNDSLRTTREQYAEEFRQREEEYQSKLAEATAQLTNTRSELERTSELLQEQTGILQATEHALQESKQKLYALINEQELKLQEQVHAIDALQSELSQTANELALAEQSIHNIIRFIPIPAFVVNSSGVCEFCNASLEQLVGYGMDELRDKHFSRFFPDDERSFFEEQWKNSANRSEQFQGETNVIAATGDSISASMNIVEVQTEIGDQKFVGFLVDHTTENDAKKHFAASKEREQELLDLKSRFIGMVSNQLRTSLVTIATNTELLERFLDKWSDERRYHSFLRINDSIRQLIELVRDVTFTTKATTEQYSLTISHINLETLFQSTARELMTDLESQHHFILSEQGDISSVPLDEKLITTIAQQLLSNAFKYSRDSTEVKVHIAQTDSSCAITIEDHGIGIPAADQKHLFSSFYRASNVSNIYGTGLGLTIVQQCVQMHNGTVAIESELHKGTTVTVTLPLTKNFS